MRRFVSSRRRAIADYYRFSFFNVISYSFLAGNIIVLYALRFGADSVLVGLIAASYQVTFVFSLIGRQIIGRSGAVKLFGYGWLFRYLLMVPVLFTGLPGIRDDSRAVLGIILFCVFAFNVSKGIGMTGSKPIVGDIPRERERGAFLSGQQVIAHLGAIATGTVMALTLGQDASTGRYLLLLSVGVLAGFAASYFILKLPEPVPPDSDKRPRFRDGVVLAFRAGPFRRLAGINMLAVFALSMVSAFLVVYFRRVYGFADGTVVFFTVAGSAGAAIMALLTRAVIDRVGAKPLLFAFGTMIAVVLVPIAAAPPLSGTLRAVLPPLLFGLFAMAHAGLAVATDNLFYSMTNRENRLDLGIVFGLGTGICGTLGSFLGGLLLSGLEAALPGHPSLPFGLYFALAALLMVPAVLKVRSLPDHSLYALHDALGMLFSPRDLRTMRLLNRLDRSRTVDEERAAVEALRQNPSRLAVEELKSRIVSPSLTIRLEAISALRNAPLTAEVEDLLIEHVQTHPYTTAHIAAELLGAAGVARAIPVLRELLGSQDYMACARAMVSLAQLGDRDSVPAIEQQLAESPNPRITIFAARALDIFPSVGSLPRIFARIERRAETFVRDELVLSSARMLGFFDWFYPLYLEFLDDQAEATRTLVEAAERAPEAVRSAAGLLAGEPRRFIRVTAEYFASAPFEVGGVDTAPFFMDALRDRNVGQLPRFRFFVAAAMVHASTGRRG